MKVIFRNDYKYLLASATILGLLVFGFGAFAAPLEDGGSDAPASGRGGGSLIDSSSPTGGTSLGFGSVDPISFSESHSFARDGRSVTFTSDVTVSGAIFGNNQLVSRNVAVIVDLGEGNLFDVVSSPGSGSTWCSISASPRSGNSPLGVNFSLSYGTSPEDCSPPTVSWSAPCNPTTGCTFTYNTPGTYGPYSATVQYFREGGRESVCSPNFGPQVSCSSGIIRVGTSPSPSPQVSPTPSPRVSPSPTPTSGPGTGGAGAGGGSQSLPPPIMTFIANPTSLPRGGASTLTWTSQNTTSCTAYCISGPCVEWGNPPFTLPFVNKPTSGSQKVTPPNTSTYRLNCFGPGGSVFEDTTVNVGVVKWREITPIF